MCSVYLLHILLCNIFTKNLWQIYKREKINSSFSSSPYSLLFLLLLLNNEDSLKTRPRHWGLFVNSMNVTWSTNRHSRNDKQKKNERRIQHHQGPVRAVHTWQKVLETSEWKEVATNVSLCGSVFFFVCLFVLFLFFF